MQEYIKKILGSGHRCHSSSSSAPKAKTLIISNDEMKDIIEIVKSLKYSGLLLKGVSETIQNESKEQKGRFLSVLLGTLGASLLGNLVAGKVVNRAVEATVRDGCGNKKGRKTTTKSHKNKKNF